jgi:hypothetical protein
MNNQIYLGFGILYVNMVMSRILNLGKISKIVYPKMDYSDNARWSLYLDKREREALWGFIFSNVRYLPCVVRFWK